MDGRRKFFVGECVRMGPWCINNGSDKQAITYYHQGNRDRWRELLIKAGYNSVKIREGFFEWGRRNEERMCGRGGLRGEEAKKRRHDLHNQRVVLLVVPLAYLMVVNFFVGTT